MSNKNIKNLAITLFSVMLTSTAINTSAMEGSSQNSSFIQHNQENIDNINNYQNNNNDNYNNIENIHNNYDDNNISNIDEYYNNIYNNNNPNLLNNYHEHLEQNQKDKIIQEAILENLQDFHNQLSKKQWDLTMKESKLKLEKKILEIENENIKQKKRMLFDRAKELETKYGSIENLKIREFEVQRKEKYLNEKEEKLKDKENELNKKEAELK